MGKLLGYGFVFLMVLLGVYGQLMLKYRILLAGALPEGWFPKFIFVLRLFGDPWILSAFASAFLGSLCWMAAMTKLPLSTAYPFTSLTFVLILIFSALFFQEPIGFYKLLGVALIIGGIIVANWA